MCFYFVLKVIIYIYTLQTTLFAIVADYNMKRVNFVCLHSLP